MPWSMVKENALRSLHPVGVEFAEYLGALSDVSDEEVPAVVAGIRKDKADAAEGRGIVEDEAIRAEHRA